VVDDLSLREIYRQVPEEQLVKLTLAMFQDFNILERFKIDVGDTHRFIIEVAKTYFSKNPFHNFRHAFDTTHMIYLFLTLGKASELLLPLEVLALMISGVLHDVGHPGVNNTFQIVTSSKLAIRYNDNSVLENHHCALGFKLLGLFGVLKNLSKEEYREIRKLVIGLVLSTDLTHHMELTNKFKSLLQGTFDKDNNEHRFSLAQALMKCADLSNPARPFNIALYWAHMVQEEFFYQGDLERQQGLPFSPFMERGTSSLPQLQINFIDYIVSPIFESLSQLLKDTSILYQNLLVNRSRWAELLQNEKLTEEHLSSEKAKSQEKTIQEITQESKVEKKDS